MDLAASVRRKAYLHIIAPLFLTSIIAYLDRVNLSYAALTMNQDLGLTDDQYGLGAGVFFLGYVLFEIPGALIAERYSPKWWLARIMVSWGILSGALAFITSPWQFYALRFLLGAAEASLYPVIYASCIPRWFVAADRPRALAVLLTSLQISNIIGAPLAGWLLDQKLAGLNGWQSLFVIEAVPAILFAFVLIRWMADSPNEAAWLTAEERAQLLNQLAREAEWKSTLGSYSLRQALGDRQVIRMCLTYFLWITGFWGFGYWMPTVLKTASGWSNQAVGWLIPLPMTLSLIVMLLVGDSASRTGEKRWHGAAGLLLAAAGLVGGTWVESPGLSFLCLCLVGIGVYAPFGVWWSYPTEFLSGAAAAGAIGLINSCGNIGGFIGPYLMGYLRTATGSNTAGWLCLSGSLLMAGILMLTFRNRLPIPSEPPAQP